MSVSARWACLHNGRVCTKELTTLNGPTKLCRADNEQKRAHENVARAMSICPSIENFEGGLHRVELKVFRAIMKLEGGPLVFAALVDLHDFGDPATLGQTCVK